MAGCEQSASKGDGVVYSKRRPFPLPSPRYEYAYDARGNRTLIRDPLLRETWFTFDAQGRQLTRTLPLGFGPDGILDTDDDLPALPPGAGWGEGYFTEHFWYNDFGRQVSHISFEGVVTVFQYDTDDGIDAGDTGRLVAKRYFQTVAAYQAWRAEQEDEDPDTLTPDELWTYNYDASGRQTNVAISLREMSTGELVEHRTETTAYDAQGRIVTIATPEGTIHYEHDPATGRRTREGAKKGTGVVYRNDPRPLCLPLDQVRSPNGVIADYDYDALNRLELLRHFRDENANGTYEATIDTLLAEYDYDLLPDGRRSGVSERIWLDANENGIVESSEIAETRIDWFYDAVGRLTREIYDGPGIDLDYATDYVFDLVGSASASNRS